MERKKKQKNQKQSKTRKYNEKIQSTQSFIPIIDIRDGIVITRDGNYVKVLEIQASNFFMKSSMERDNIVSTFASMLRISPDNLQIKAISTRTDIEEHLKILDAEIDKEQNKECVEMQFDFLQTLQETATFESISHRFFVAFRYPIIKMAKKPSFAQIKNELNTYAVRISQLMIQCGNKVIEAKNEDEHIREIFYCLFNRNRREKISDEKQVYAVLTNYGQKLGIDNVDDLPPIQISEFIAPQSMSFDTPNYATIDGRYYTWLYIPSNGYTNFVTAGWIAAATNVDEGIDVDIYLKKEDPATTRKKVSKVIQSSRIQMEEISDAQQGFEGMANTLSSANFIREELRNGEELFNVSTIITVSAQTLEELNEKVRIVTDSMEIQNMKVSKVFAQTEQAFLSTLPLSRLEPNIFNKSKRNVTTKSAAAFYPFLSQEICDPDGLYIGLSKSTGTLVSPDIFDKRKYTNANIFICGKTGAGKTFTLLTLATRARLKQIPVYIVAPVKGEEFRNVCSFIGGQYIRFGAGSKSRINVMEIRSKDDRADRLLYEDYEEMEDSYLSAKITDLLVFFSLLDPGITLEEKQILDKVLISVYAKYGITMDNRTLEDSKHRWLNVTMPTLEDVYNEIENIPELRTIKTILNKLVHGSASSFNGQTNVNLNNLFTVIDLSPLGRDEDLLPPAMFMAIDYVVSKAKEDSTKKKLVVFDEWWKFTLSDYAAKYSMEIARVIRAYGGGAVFATQQLSDAGGRLASNADGYARAVLNACKTKIILGLEVDEAEYVQRALRLTDTETHEIMHNPTGVALLVTNDNSLTIQIKASEKETELFSTDRESKARKIMKKEEELQRKQEAEKNRVNKKIERNRLGKRTVVLNSNEDEMKIDWNSAVISPEDNPKEKKNGK